MLSKLHSKIFHEQILYNLHFVVSHQSPSFQDRESEVTGTILLMSFILNGFS